MPVRLVDSLATTEALAALFSDQSILQAMLDFEVALARAEARFEIIPSHVADTIAKSANLHAFDIAAFSLACEPERTRSTVCKFVCEESFTVVSMLR